ncbi:MAG: 2-C-methyl-D-erythritol 4-phosphate cytidylyltransferase [Dorea sp.]|nr:2-C-methyl-D-erythritol 4-phosphate cytidylyltransferase [Dorea sp.]
MVSAIILAGGTGARMRNKGLPKQFLPLYGKPIIIYTLEKFQECVEVDEIIIPCNKDWIDHMQKLVKKFNITKVKAVINGGADRSLSVVNGLRNCTITSDEDIVLIHDGVRPLVKEETIIANIKTAREKGNAMTVKRNIETVVYTETEDAVKDDFKNRDFTYTLTAPQSFKTKECLDIYEEALASGRKIPLDASLLYTELGKKVFLVVEEGLNLKITTPEDFYYLRSYLEYQENINILGV